MKTIDVLQGNVFDCGPQNPLPPNDPIVNSYFCGSDEFQDGIYTQAVLTVMILAGLALMAWAAGRDVVVETRSQ